MLRSPFSRHKPTLSQSSLELHLSTSSVSAANSSITGASGSGSGSASAGDSQQSYCRGHLLGGDVEDDGQSVDSSTDFRPPSSIPHLLSAASDDDDNDDVDIPDDYANPYFERDHADLGINRGGRRRQFVSETDRFETMLQQQSEHANLDDSIASVVFLGDDNTECSNQYPMQTATASTRALVEPAVAAPVAPTDEPTSPNSIEGKRNWSDAGKQLLSKFSRSHSTDGSTPTAQPIMMMFDLDDDDAELPWMLSQSDLGTKVFTSDTVSACRLIAPLPLRDEEQSLPPQPPPSKNIVPSASTTTQLAPQTHRRRTSSFSSASSQSSFRSILRNGNNMTILAEAAEGNEIKSGGLATRTPLMPRSGNRNAPAGDEKATSHHRIIADKENPSDAGGAHRGRSSIDKRESRSRRSVSHSARKSRREARSVDGRPAPATDIKDASSHRRTVSFPAELIQKERTCPSSDHRHHHRGNPKSQVALPPPRKYSDDPALTPLLDMGSSRNRRNSPSHVRSATDISPRTAEFLAHDSPAVAAMCEAQEREKYGHHHYRHHPRIPDLGRSGGSVASASRSVGHTCARSMNEALLSPGYSGHNTYPPPAIAYSPKQRLQAAYQQQQQQQQLQLESTGTLISTSSSTLFSEQSASNGISPTSSIDSGHKRRFFSFSAADRKGRVSFKHKSLRKKRFPLVGLLSPVEEFGEGSITCGTTPTPLSEPTPVSADGDETRYDYPAINNQPSFASDGSYAENGGKVVSPVSNELAKAANVVWGAPSSPSSASSRSHSLAAIQCQCVIS